MKWFLIFLAFIMFAARSSAQVKKVLPPRQGKDWLLWYQGTKQNDSVLLTNTGWKVTYKRSVNKVEVNTGKQVNQFDKMAAELDRSTTRKIEMVRRIAGDKPDPSDLPMIQIVIEAVDDIEKQYRAALKNTIDLPPAGSIPEDPSLMKNSKGPFSDIETTTEPWKELYARIKADIKALNDPSKVELGVPPSYDVSICYHCDSLAQKRMDKRGKDYLQTLKNDEEHIARDIFRLFQLLNSLQDKNGEFPPEIQEINDELKGYLGLIGDRVSIKLERLVATYKHDFLKIGTIMPLILGLNRQYQLLGVGTYSADLELTSLFNTDDINAYIKKLMEEEDYNRVLNISWILAMERQFQLVGMPGFMQGEQFKKLLDFNNFRLTITADAKEQRDDYFRAGQVKSEVAYYKAILTEDCRFVFVQSIGSKAMGVGKPFVNFDLLRAESSEGTYIGNKKWVMIDPYIKIGFCGDDDTLRLFVIMPSLQEPYETWQTPVGPTHPGEVTGLFSDAFENNNNMVDEDEGMLQKMQEIQAFTADLSSAEEIVFNPMQLNRAYFIIEKIKETVSKNALTLVPVSAKNKSTVLFDQLYNGKLYSANEHISYANLWIKLEHVKE